MTCKLSRARGPSICRPVVAEQALIRAFGPSARATSAEFDPTPLREWPSTCCIALRPPSIEKTLLSLSPTIELPASRRCLCDLLTMRADVRAPRLWMASPGTATTALSRPQPKCALQFTDTEDIAALHSRRIVSACRRLRSHHSALPVVPSAAFCQCRRHPGSSIHRERTTVICLSLV